MSTAVSHLHRGSPHLGSEKGKMSSSGKHGKPFIKARHQLVSPVDRDDSDKENTYNGSLSYTSLTSTPVPRSANATSPSLTCSSKKLFSPIQTDRTSKSATKARLPLSYRKDTPRHSACSITKKLDTTERSLSDSYVNVTSVRQRLHYTRRTRPTDDALASTSTVTLSAEHCSREDSDSFACCCQTLNDVSGFSDVSTLASHDQVSGSDLYGNFHSTFSYPLHSTVACTPNNSLDISGDLAPNFAEQFVLASEAGKPAATAVEITDPESSILSRPSENELGTSSADTDDTCSSCDSSYLSDDEISIDVDEYAAQYESIRKKLAEGQLLLFEHCDASRSGDHGTDEDGLSEDSWGSSLSDVWYSPNNTVSSDIKLVHQMSTPSERHQRRTKVVYCSPTSPSVTHPTADLVIMTDRQHSEDTDSGCSSCDSHTQQKRGTICDNTGQCRSVTRRDTCMCLSVSSEDFSLLTES